MSSQEKAASQAGWALITGGVNAARVDAHRIHHLLNKVLKIVESSPQKEHIYQVAGDIILAMPALVEKIEGQLDETGYALACMGKEHLKERLPISDRNRVEVTVEGSPTFSAPSHHSSAEKVAERFLAKCIKAQ